MKDIKDFGTVPQTKINYFLNVFVALYFVQPLKINKHRPKKRLGPNLALCWNLKDACRSLSWEIARCTEWKHFHFNPIKVHK